MDLEYFLEHVVSFVLEFWNPKFRTFFGKNGSQVAPQRGLHGSSPAPKPQPKGSTLKINWGYVGKNLNSIRIQKIIMRLGEPAGRS